MAALHRPAPGRPAGLSSLSAPEILAADPNPIVILDADGEVVFANEAAATLLARDLAELAGSWFDELVVERPRGGFAETRRGLIASRIAAPVHRLVQLRRGDGSARLVEMSLGRLDGATPLAFAVLVDVTEREAAEQRLRMLASLGTVISGAATLGDVAETVVAACMAALRATTAALGVVGHDDLRIVATRGLSKRQERLFSRIPLTAALPITDAIATREPVVVAGASTIMDRYPTFDGTSPGSCRVAVPFLVERRAIGALSLSFDDEGAGTADIVQFLETVAATCAQALERARLLARERRARDRSAALASLNTAVLEARAPEEIARLLLDAAIPTFEAARGAVWFRDASRERLELVEIRGYPPDLEAASRDIPVAGDTPVGAAVRTGDVIAFDKRADAGVYDDLQGDPVGWPSSALVVLPLAAPDGTLGAITLGFDDPAVFGATELVQLRAFVQAGAAAVARARIHDEERRTRRLLEAVIGQLPVGLLVVHAPSGRVLFANRLAEELLGLPETADGTEVRTVLDVSGVTVQRPDGGQLSPSERPIVRSLRDGVTIDDDELVVVHPDGGRAVLLVSAAPVRDADGAVIAAVSTFADISARAQAVAARDAFIGVLSHELRTPVTTIYGAAKLLDSDRDLDRTARRELAADIAAESERLRRLVEDLLVLTRVERGVDLERSDPVLVGHVTRRVVDNEALRHPGLRIRLDIDPRLPPASGDEAYVEQVLRNLLSNAAKYGPPGGAVSVRVEREVDGIAVRVEDEGPGIGPGDEERVFDLFYRVPATAGSAPGAGIGLYACRALVRAMGGRIWARGRADGGAEVGFVLPLFPEEPA